MFNTLSSSEKPPNCRGNTGKRRMTGHLVATDTGIVSAGNEVEPPRANYNAAMRNRRAEEIKPGARRHIDPHHIDFSDEQKRYEGRMGKAKVISNEQQAREMEYYKAPERKTVPQPGGQECNLYLKSYYYTPVEGPKRSAREGDLSVSANPQSTSVQLAEARLRRIEKEHPKYAGEVQKIMQSPLGDTSIVERENELSRRINREVYARGAQKRVEDIEKGTKYHGRPDLGSPAPAIEKNVPYALNFSAPRPDNVKNAGSGLHITRNHNAESSPQQRIPQKAVDRKLYDGPKPYDTVDVSGISYPSPPEVGVSQSMWEKPFLVRHDNRRSATCKEDRDTLALKRARARQASQSTDRTTDNIFGAPAQSCSPPAKTLRYQTENRWKQEEKKIFERHTGKAHVGPQYKDTSLW